ncbi:MAG: hypothetical protein ACSLEL_01080 [Candidatus Malihini olakiniferum]
MLWSFIPVLFLGWLYVGSSYHGHASNAGYSSQQSSLLVVLARQPPLMSIQIILLCSIGNVSHWYPAFVASAVNDFFAIGAYYPVTCLHHPVSVDKNVTHVFWLLPCYWCLS